MKKIASSAGMALLFSISLLACKKESPLKPSGTTLRTTAEYLTDHTWKLQEARFVQDNVMTYYSRGITGNGATFDPDSIRFNSNNTGVYYNSGGTSNLTWSFLDVEETKLTIVFPINGFTINWMNVHVTDSTFRYAEYYTLPESDILSMGAFYRTPR